MKPIKALVSAFSLILSITYPSLGFAADEESPNREVAKPQDEPVQKSWFAPTAAHEDGPRSVYWRPLVSILIPGFDQYSAGHLGSGLAYSSVWIASSAWSINRKEKWDEVTDNQTYRDLSKEDKAEYQFHDERGRQYLLSSQISQDVGFLSAYHAFRTSVATQQAIGKYKFLTKEETPADLLAAPFTFSNLKRKTTWIPLTVVAALGALQVNHPPEDRQRRSVTAGDAMYTGAISYNAGVSEEALFRGYLQPLFYEAWQSSLWSNLAQATIFAAAHYSSTNSPVIQLGFGYYMGWLSQNQDWTISETIFIHTWWDVIAVTSSYMTERKLNKAAVLWTPAFRMML